MRQPSKFWDRLAYFYSKRPVADEASYQKKLRVTREYLRPDMEVLEFGCGTGSTAFAHAPYVKHIQAIDFSSKMIEIAQRKAIANKVSNVSLRRSSIEEFSVAEQTLDAVLGLNVLHLLDNKEAVIAKVHRMLKPGGIFVTSTTCIGDTMKVFRRLAPIGQFLGVLPRIKFFTVAELEASLTEGGFTIEYQWQPGKDSAVFIVAKKAV